jgi:iron complex outermembrane receptor protein
LLYRVYPSDVLADTVRQQLRWRIFSRSNVARARLRRIHHMFHVGADTYSVNAAFYQFAPLAGFSPPNERIGGCNLLNLRTGYRFWQQKAAAGYMRDAEVAVSVFNALNDEHKEHPLGDLIGRRVMGWLTVRF